MFEDLQVPTADNPPADDDVYKRTVRVLNAHFVMKVNPMYEKHVFCQLSFKAGETTYQFVAHLRYQAHFCQFNNVTQVDNAIHNQLVSTNQDNDLCKTLL